MADKKGIKRKRTSLIPANSEARNILFAITVFEWQAEYSQLAQFSSKCKSNSLTRALIAQFREFGKQNIKPYQLKDIYDK